MWKILLFDVHRPGKYAILVLEHSHTKPENRPCYENLKTNVPTQLMAVTLLDVPLATPEYVPHGTVLEYIQKISSKYGVSNVTTYGARVEDVKKLGDKWALTWTMAPKHNEDGYLVEGEHQSVSQNFEIFDDYLLIRFCKVLRFCRGSDRALPCPSCS